MTGIKKIIYDMTNIDGTTIELEEHKTKITKEYKGRKQPEIKKIIQTLQIPIRNKIKKAIIFIEIEHEANKNKVKESTEH